MDHCCYCCSFEAWFDVEHIGDEMAADEQKKDVLSMLHQVRPSPSFMWSESAGAVPARSECAGAAPAWSVSRCCTCKVRVCRCCFCKVRVQVLLL